MTAIPGGPTTAIAVFCGGSLGALARYGLGEWLAPVGVVLTATVVANLLGSAILGVLAGVAARRGERGLAWSLLGVGFSGALTTFSTFAVEAIAILDDAGPAAAAVYLGGSVLAGLWVATAARRRSLAW
ncbi:MAG: CrcB family protein [bacterium]|nr:CrcB family protein [bacterium]MDE0600643.1 CrcB family protein [bacterium]